MYLILIIGHTGQGKTPYVNKFLHNKHLPPALPNVKGKYTTTEKSLYQYIFDVNNEYTFPDDQRTCPQMRHTGYDVKAFIKKASELKRYNVVMEDATGFLQGKQELDFRRMISAKMFTQNNYIILFHSVTDVPPFLMRMSNIVVLFKTLDNVKEVERKFNNDQLTKGVIKLQAMKKYSYLQLKLI